MQYCSESFLGRVSWNALRDCFLEKPEWRSLFPDALRHYFQSLDDNSTATLFAGRNAQEAAEWINELLAKEKVSEGEITLTSPVLALFHFSHKDIFRCLHYRDKLRGLSCAGGTLVHLGLHVPGVPWAGNSEALKTFSAYRELGELSRQSSTFSSSQAEARVVVLRSLLLEMPEIDEDGTLIDAARAKDVTTESGARAKLKAAKALLGKWRQRLVVLLGYARELPSFERSPAHRDALVAELLEAFGQCRRVIDGLAGVRFVKSVDKTVKVLPEGGKAKKPGKPKKISTDGFRNELVADLAKMREFLRKCLGLVEAHKAPAGEAIRVFFFSFFFFFFFFSSFLLCRDQRYG